MLTSSESAGKIIKMSHASKVIVAIFLYIVFSSSLVFAGNAYVGPGKTTATCIDKDGDGYGIGDCPSGTDADDNDATVNTQATVEAKYGSMTTGSNATIAANIKSFFCASRGYCNIDDIWFVSNTGDNTTGVKNDITKPFRYVGYSAGIKGKTGFGAGDMVLWRGGTYASTLGGESKDQIDTTYSMPVGTVSSPIIFATFPGEKVIFSGAYEGINGQNQTLKDLWYIFDGFQIGTTTADTAGNGIVLTGAREVIWRNIEIYRKGAAGMRIMSFVSWPTVQVPLKNILFENSIVKGGGTVGIATHNIYWGHSIPKGYNNPAIGCRVKNIISYGNVVSYDGMQFNGHFEDWSVEGSQFHSASSWGFSTINGPSNGKFTNNLVYNNNSAGIKIGKYVGFVGNNMPNGESNVENNLWANNTIWVGSTFNGNGPNDGRAPSAWNPIHFYTETTCSPAPIDYTDQLTGVHYNVGDSVCPDYTTSHNGNIFRNNILISNGSSPIRSDQRSHLEHNIFDHNIMYRTDGSNLVANLKNNTETWTLAQFQGDAKITANNNINTDPLFVDAELNYATTPGRFNFRIKPTSPAVSLGFPLNAPATDVRGVLRFPSPTAGAYENRLAPVTVRR